MNNTIVVNIINEDFNGCVPFDHFYTSGTNCPLARAIKRTTGSQNVEERVNCCTIDYELFSHSRFSYYIFLQLYEDYIANKPINYEIILTLLNL